MPAKLGRNKIEKTNKTFDTVLKVFYFVVAFFIVKAFCFSTKLMAQKKKAFVILESDISSPEGISNKAFRKGLSGVVNYSSNILLCTPNGKRNFGLGFQRSTFKAGLNANNISGNNNTLFGFNSLNLKFGTILYADYMFKIQGFLLLNYNFLKVKSVEVPFGEVYDATTKRFFSYQPGFDFFLRAQENIYVGFRLSYNYLIYKYNPEEFYLNELRVFSPNDYSKNVGILNFGLSFRYEFNKNPDE